MAYALPSTPKIAGVRFDLARNQAINVSRGGANQTVDLGEPLWTAELETTALTRALAGEYDALRAKLRGAARTLYVYDASRPRPIAYHDTPDASGARIGVTTRRIGSSTLRIGRAEHPWGSPRILQYDRAGGRVLLDGLRAGATLSPGDYCAWDEGPTRRLSMIVEPLTADAAGQGWATIEPIPPVSALAAPPYAVTMQRAAAEMILASAQRPFSVSARWSLTLQAMQVLTRF